MKGTKLIVFAREPIPGRVKSRLAPALGADGAASLYLSMAAHTLRWASCLDPGVRGLLEVRYDGGSAAVLAGLAGPGVRFVPQGGGDLGVRMRRAFRDAFAAGKDKVVLVGTDCPELTAAHARTAWEALRESNMVLGPTYDRGYCLIGLDRDCPAVFDDMPWGTDEVLDRTVERARASGLVVKLLAPLHDIDEPSDLPFWTRVSRQSLSIVIPSLDEERDLPRTLETLEPDADVEVIVADGGSRDASRALAEQAGAKVVISPAGRARQMNAGAAEAAGDILLFLHADTLPPPGFVRLIRDALRDPDVAGGSFALGFEPCPPLLKITELTANARARLLRLPFGDQALFVRAPVFRLLRGFREWPLMEDVDFVRRLGRVGKLASLRPPVRSSSRRYDRCFLRRTLRNKAVFLGYLLGVPPARLSRLYGPRDKSPGPI